MRPASILEFPRRKFRQCQECVDRVAEHAAPWTYRKLSAVIFASGWGRGLGRQEASHRVEYIRSADK